MKLITLILGLVLVAATSVTGLIYNNDDNIVLQDIIQSDGTGADCNINVSNTSAIVYSDAMSVTGSLYYEDIGTLSAGDYCYAIECNKSSDTYTAGGCFFVADKRTETYLENIETDTNDIETDMNDGVTLENDAITSAKIAASAIGASEIAANAIGASEIASGAIDADAIAANAIGASEVATDAIGAAEAGFLTDSTGFDGADIATILTDTAAQDTAGEWDTLMATALSYIDGDGSDGIDADIDDIKTDTNDIETDLNDGVSLTAATESQIDDIDTDVEDLLTNQSVILAAINVIDGIVDSILVDTAAFDTAAEYATAIWNAATGSYGGAGTYGQAVEDTLADTDEIQQNQSNFVSGSASITADDKTDIANQTFHKILQSYNASYTYDSDGFPSVDTYTYTDGTTVTETWAVNSSNVIENKTVVKS